MLFTSITFIFVFLPVTLIIYYLLRNNRRAQNIELCLSSLLFYAWGEPVFVLVMVASVAVNWAAGLAIERRREQDRHAAGKILAAAVAADLGLLFVFKYLMLAVKTVNMLLLTDFGVPQILLPIGISFFTFQEISYVTDIYRGKAGAQKDLLSAGLYITFFPQLIAGPIVRYDTIETQILGRRENWQGVTEGIERFIIGFARKVIIANNLAIVADQAFAMSGGGAKWQGVPVDLGAGMAWLGALAYMFQIYYDFSGYSDMAIGLGKMFGFRLPENFDHPYISGSVTEFWHRWHMSLGTWFRDYLYIPLGGSRRGKWRNLLNLLIVWALTGFWHGANWTFLVWGLMSFAAIAVERAAGIGRKKSAGAAGAARWALTMLFILIGWIVFRSDSLPAAAEYISCLVKPAASAGSAGAGTGAALVMSADVSRFYLGQYWPFFAAAAVFSVPVSDFVKDLFKKKETENSGSTVAKSNGSESSGAVLFGAKWLILAILFAVSVSYVVRGSYDPFIYFNF